MGSPLTERAMEAKLAGSEAWFRSLVQHAPEYLAVVDRDGMVKYASPSAAQLLGYDAGELQGTRFCDLRAP